MRKNLLLILPEDDGDVNVGPLIRGGHFVERDTASRCPCRALLQGEKRFELRTLMRFISYYVTARITPRM